MESSSVTMTSQLRASDHVMESESISEPCTACNTRLSARPQQNDANARPTFATTLHMQIRDAAETMTLDGDDASSAVAIKQSDGMHSMKRKSVS